MTFFVQWHTKTSIFTRSNRLWRFRPHEIPRPAGDSSPKWSHSNVADPCGKQPTDHGFLYHGGHGPTRQCISRLPAFSVNVFAVPPGHLPPDIWRGVTIEWPRDAGWRRGVSAEGPRDPVVLIVNNLDEMPHRGQKILRRSQHRDKPLSTALPRFWLRCRIFLEKKLQSSNFVHGLATRTTNFHMTNCPSNGCS